MQGDVEGLRGDNNELKDKLNEITMVLYQKMEENSILKTKLESYVNQNQQMAIN